MRRLALRYHLLLLCAFAALAVCLWMLPTFLAGFPYVLVGYTPDTRALLEAGMITTGSGRLMNIMALWLHPFIGWENMIGWTLVSAIGFALALFPWWWSVYRLFDTRIAWISTVILSFIPLYWIEAVRFSGYSFAFFFLFLGFALFWELRSRNRLAAAATFGICFGAALGSRDAFITFFPWFVCAYLWCERTQWKRAVVEVCVFAALAYAAFTAPLISNAFHTEGSFMERAAILLPTNERAGPEPGHLYPDDYTFENEREAYDEILRERAKDSSFLVQQRDASYRWMLGVSDWSLVESLTNSVWISFNALPPLFLQDKVGGFFLWLFILPGIASLYVLRRKLLILLLSLWITMEFLLRFVLHFVRDHLMDVGWMLALFAAVGVVTIITPLQKKWKALSVNTLSALVVILIALQLMQVNRKQFAYFYGRSNVPVSYAAAEVLNEIPSDAVVAHPRQYHLFYFSDRTNFNIHNETIDRLSEEGRLRDPFAHYGVTHIVGYSDERTDMIRRAVPGVKVITIPEDRAAIPLTPFMRYLLHILR